MADRSPAPMSDEIAITFPALLGALERIAERLEVIEEKIDRPAAPGWFTVASAAGYLGTTQAAIRKAEASGKLECSRNKSGRLSFTKAQLDRYARGGSDGR